jgi:hypothetical protein
MRMACGEERASPKKHILLSANGASGVCTSPGFPQMPRGWQVSRWRGTLWEEAVDCLSLSLGVLDSCSRRPHPARTVSQAKEGERLSTEELPSNQQRIPKMSSPRNGDIAFDTRLPTGGSPARHGVWHRWRRVSGWHGYGWYSLIAALVKLVLVAVEFWAFTPGTPLAPARVGGLLERVLSVEMLAWYVVFGWRLFVLAGSRQKEREQTTPVKTREHKS